MDKAIQRIISALQNKEKIWVYGDYDVDGISAISLLIKFFRTLSAEVFFYVPNRLNEGYGLSELGINTIHQNGADLIITVDCGITADQEIAQANALGIDVIITDHHLPKSTLPPAYAVINPKIEKDNFPAKELSGVGVAFKLVQGIYERLHPAEQNGLSPALSQYLDFVSIGTAADIVPLTGENRIFVRNGFDFLKRSSCEGIKALLNQTGLYKKEIGTGHVVFQIAPMINAAGRLGDPRRAVEFFITDQPEEAKSIAQDLKNSNEARKTIDQSITEECFSIIDNNIDLEKTFFLILASEKWHPGVVGIVASRIVERYCRPALVMSVEEGMARGSARSITGFHILEAIRTCENLIDEYGGHQHAAGISIKAENIETLKSKLNKFALTKLSPKDLIPGIKTDALIADLDMINWTLVEVLKKFEPFGPNNMRPVFYTQDVNVVGEPRIVGNNHLRFKVRTGNLCFNAIGFKMGNRLLDIHEPGRAITLAYVIEENEWMDEKTIQINVRGIE
jgi:single-stranded-DNA-specific exonuclease